MKEKKNRWIIECMCMGAILILGVLHFERIIKFGSMILSVVRPLMIGLIIAYALNLLMRRLEVYYFPKTKNQFLKKSRRPVCILLSFLVILGIMCGILFVVLPQLVNTVSVFLESVPKFINNVGLFYEEHGKDYPVIQSYIERLNLDLNQIMKNAMAVGSNIATNVLNSSLTAASNLTSQIVQTAIGLIFAIYILASKEKLTMQLNSVMKAYLKPSVIEKVHYVVQIADNSFSSFIAGQCMEAVILGTLCSLGMMIFRFPYAGMIGTFIGATALIPVVGAYLGAGLGILMIVMVDPFKALLFIVYIVVLQQLENNLIYPKVVGSSIGLPGMWVLVAVTIGGGLAGVAGMMIGVPLTATIYKLMKNDVTVRLTAK